MEILGRDRIIAGNSISFLIDAIAPHRAEEQAFIEKRLGPLIKEAFNVDITGGSVMFRNEGASYTDRLGLYTTVIISGYKRIVEYKETIVRANNISIFNRKKKDLTNSGWSCHGDMTKDYSMAIPVFLQKFRKEI